MESEQYHTHGVACRGPGTVRSVPGHQMGGRVKSMWCWQARRVYARGKYPCDDTYTPSSVRRASKINQFVHLRWDQTLFDHVWTMNVELLCVADDQTRLTVWHGRSHPSFTTLWPNSPWTSVIVWPWHSLIFTSLSSFIS